MSTYSNYPSLDELAIEERVDAFRRTCIGALARGEFSQAMLDQALAEALANEQYELAQGITAARSQFKQKPQLSFL